MESKVRKQGRPKKTDILPYSERAHLDYDPTKNVKLTEEYARDMVNKMSTMLIADENILDAKELLSEVKLPQSSYYKMRQMFPFVKQFYEMSRTIIGARREKRALMGKIDAGIVSKTLNHYDDDYRTTHIELNKAEKEKSLELVAELGEILRQVQSSKENVLPYKKKKSEHKGSE